MNLSRARVTSSGLRPTVSLELVAVRYTGTYDLGAKAMSRWIFDDLVARAGETLQREFRAAERAAETADEKTAAGRLTVSRARTLARMIRSNGAKVALADYDRVRVTVTGEGDVYGTASDFGVVVSEDGQTVAVECARRDVPQFTAAGLTVRDVVTTRTCPT